MKITTYIKKDTLYFVLITLSFLSLLRALIVPIFADEITYKNLADSIMEGRYYLNNQPSTVTPVIPFIMSLFYSALAPTVGIILMKCFNILMMCFGFRYVYLFLKSQGVDIRIVTAILVLTLTNTTSIAWFSRIYPEAILFFSFWGFLYYYTKEISISNFRKMLFFFALLTLTRYLYILLGVFVLIYYYKCFYKKALNRRDNIHIILSSLVIAIPLLIWFKYVYFIEQNQTSGISYFHRFKEDNIFIYNIKCGLGLLQHHEVNKINGIPAFISLFVPITGLRNFLISIVLIVLFLLGYIKAKKSYGIVILFSNILIIMVGFILAGTGFSRYWLLLLPGFYLGYYYIYKTFKLKDEWFIRITKCISIVYVLNELRLDYMVITAHL
ncbi:hypothetical protein [uncultured Dokdonia sp.]|uniref:hypothetical protein n=1 Tax=uncultured Dokdonia sp. TaxID=575653 RepID=UPI002624C118|nr:hypothetical protein [uncultured Dokdonia sp.]